MQIQKLEFFINPQKLFPFLDQEKGGGQLCLLHDATEKGFSIIGYGTRVIAGEEFMKSEDDVRQVFEKIEKDLSDKKLKVEHFLTTYAMADEVKKLPFVYGLLGFFSYDFGLVFEGIQSRHENIMSYPQYYFLDPNEVVIFDHEEKVMWVFHADDKNLREREDFYYGLRSVHFKEAPSVIDEDALSPVSNLSREMYENKIADIKTYLKNGESYQVNFSQRFTFQNLISPLQMYLNVTEINPSKFQAYMEGQTSECGHFSVVSNSPERLFKIDASSASRTIETRPIKGTAAIPRGASRDDIATIGKGLVQSEKDRAELEMIVDMSRNDLGRICEFGTIEVSEHRVVEQYSHLLHTVSNVNGVLKNDVDLYDVFRAMFPGASITGCPKKRTMEIIDELEDSSRGVYCGSIGYLDYSGNVDFNIMIRTLFATENNKAGHFYVMHSGGGVVFDSEPDLEFEETFDKVNAFLQAIT